MTGTYSTTARRVKICTMGLDKLTDISLALIYRTIDGWKFQLTGWPSCGKGEQHRDMKAQLNDISTISRYYFAQGSDLVE